MTRFLIFFYFVKQIEKNYSSIYGYRPDRNQKDVIMVVGTGKIKFKLYGIGSLKEKRRIVKSIINRIKNKFNISIAETDYNDSYLWVQIGFSIIGNDSRVVNSKLDKVFNMADDIGLAQIADTQMEIIHL